MFGEEECGKANLAGALVSDAADGDLVATHLNTVVMRRRGERKGDKRGLRDLQKKRISEKAPRATNAIKKKTSQKTEEKKN